MRRLFALPLMLASLPSPAARLVVEPLQGAGDRPLHIAVEGLDPIAPVQIRMTMRDAKGQPWSAKANLHADANGVADVASAGAEDGSSYAGVDADGLIWSMLPESGKGEPLPFPIVHRDDGLLFRPAEFVIEAYQGERLLGRQVAQRWLASPQVRAEPAHIPGVVANLYYPQGAREDGKRHPVVITLGGAEGGIEAANDYAAWLASNGFIGLALAYYRMPGLPKDLIRVPIDPIATAMTWLQAQPFVAADGIGVMGGSWGGIVSLAIASHDPRVRAVVAWVGSPTPYPGIRRDVAPADFRTEDVPALTWHGQPLPYLPFRPGVNWAAPQTAEQAATLERALLPIERINGPVLLVGSGDDRLAFSGDMAVVALRRLQARRSVPQPDQLLYYSDAGHLITQMRQPTTFRHQAGPYIPVGGSPQGYARADRDSSAKVLAFLHAALK
ncbi:acyl-CoA thioester hydrolase/BAAT C-terminal domain-containing protein [Xanthomonas sacchari]|uniref:acyl-CoA thioester hydrolase/BAAT C-terminal domain-containing protein n=1 Tax=Xanthomonas sacchari TaxID=56458 RepID=UPI0035279C9C